MVGSSWDDSPAVHPSSLERRVARFLAFNASHANEPTKFCAVELRLLQKGFKYGRRTALAAPKSKRARKQGETMNSK